MEVLKKFDKTKGNAYMKFQIIASVDEFFGYTIAIILFAAVLKIIRLLRFNNRFAMLMATLKGCWEELSGFLVVFFFMFFAFVQLFYMILYTNLDEFRTVLATLQTCFTMLLNKFKFGSIKETSLTAAVMFFFFAISCSFILINVLLTIIIDAFERVSLEFAIKHFQVK